MTFSLIANGNIFLLQNSQWALLDTSSIDPERIFNNDIDRASYYLTKSLEAFSKLRLRNDESVFLETLIYDLFTNVDKLNEWLPGSGEAERIDLTTENITAYMKDGSTVQMPNLKEKMFKTYIRTTLSDDEEEEEEEPPPRLHIQSSSGLTIPLNDETEEEEMGPTGTQLVDE